MVRRRLGCLLASVLTLLVIAVLLCLAYSWLWADRAARRDFGCLLAGDESISVTGAKIEKGNKAQAEIVLADAEVLDYLSEMLRSAKPREGVAGMTYYMNLQLSAGTHVRCGLFVPERKDQITIAFPLGTFGDPTWYAVTLREPVPKKLREILDRLSGRPRHSDDTTQRTSLGPGGSSIGAPKAEVASDECA